MALFWVSPSLFPCVWVGDSQWSGDLRFIWLFVLVFLLIPAMQLLIYGYFSASRENLLQPRPWRDDAEELMNRDSMKSMLAMHIGLPMLLSVMVYLSKDNADASLSRKRWMEIPSPPLQQFLWQHIVSLLVVDCAYYWLHRVLHVPQFYHIHKVHHQATKLTPWMGDWLHVFEFALTSVPTVLLPILWFGWGPSQVGFWIVLLNTHTFYQHSGLNCMYVPGLQLMPFGNQAVHHDRHHSANTGNYGSYFLFWDRLMHTTIEASSDHK